MATLWATLWENRATFNSNFWSHCCQIASKVEKLFSTNTHSWETQRRWKDWWNAKAADIIIHSFAIRPLFRCKEHTFDLLVYLWIHSSYLCVRQRNFLSFTHLYVIYFSIYHFVFYFLCICRSILPCLTTLFLCLNVLQRNFLSLTHICVINFSIYRFVFYFLFVCRSILPCITTVFPYILNVLSFTYLCVINFSMSIYHFVFTFLSVDPFLNEYHIFLYVYVAFPIFVFTSM